MKRSRYLLCIALIAVAGFLSLGREISAMTPSRPLAAFPEAVAGWKKVAEENFDARLLEVLRPTDYLSRVYSKGDGLATLYLGFHGGGPESGEVHSPRNCLPGSGWLQLSDEEYSFVSNGRKIDAMLALYSKDEQKQLFLYWFEVAGVATPDEYRMKVEQLRNTLLHSRKDVMFVRISVKVDGDLEKAKTLAQGFAADATPVIAGFLPAGGG